ncbi:HupE/UreJ family protein [Actinomycetospora sp. CA-101289]|uniref:HupE/UreJ family protein n=1 Tax=Actinomycetospora sp. CA-101289 TaxID=3239893 RepID=UPI003D958BA9
MTLLAACLMAGVALVLVPASASAHPLSTTAVLLDLGPDRVTGQVQLPLDRLAIALGQPGLTPTVAAQPAKLDELRTYVGAHLTATDAPTNTPWSVSVGNSRLGSVDGVDHLLVDAVFTPPNPGADLTVRYDGIVHRLVSHRILVSARPAGTDDEYTAVGVLDWRSQTLDVPVQASLWQGFVAAVGLGVHHIAEGADHLLFLLMLLLPAPLLARRGRWVRADDLGRQVRRTVHVVTAFAVGHSITLALAALGYISVPTAVVESLIAVSILVSGVHAIRPIVRGGEVWIAAGFGLMHGLAFAALLGELGLGRSSLVTELLGFNLGIELTQLIVVALLMPSLIVLSRSRAYPVVRTTLAGLGIVLAAGWLAQRTTLLDTDPFEGVSDGLVAHPWALPTVLAAAAAAVLVTQRRRTPTGTPDRPTDPSSADGVSPSRAALRAR